MVLVFLLGRFQLLVWLRFWIVMVLLIRNWLFLDWWIGCLVVGLNLLVILFMIFLRIFFSVINLCRVLYLLIISVKWLWCFRNWCIWLLSDVVLGMKQGVLVMLERLNFERFGVLLLFVIWVCIVCSRFLVWIMFMMFLGLFLNMGRWVWLFFRYWFRILVGVLLVLIILMFEWCSMIFLIVCLFRLSVLRIWLWFFFFMIFLE